MDVLTISDPGATSWLERRLPKLHLLLGDSIARDSGMISRLRNDVIFSRARGGATWSSLGRSLPDLLREWSAEAEELGRTRGAVLVWITGNDVYNRYTGLSSYSENILMDVSDHAGSVIHTLMLQATEVIVLGPLPRLSGEVMGTRWEQTAAFHLERRLFHQLPRGTRFVPLGRQLTRKSGGRYACVAGCQGWYSGDGVHLSPAGYAKLADAAELPVWLRLSAAE